MKVFRRFVGVVILSGPVALAQVCPKGPVNITQFSAVLDAPQDADTVYRASGVAGSALLPKLRGIAEPNKPVNRVEGSGQELTRQDDCTWMDRTEFESGGEVSLDTGEQPIIRASQTPGDGNTVYMLKERRFVAARKQIKKVYHKPAQLDSSESPQDTWIIFTGSNFMLDDSVVRRRLRIHKAELTVQFGDHFKSGQRLSLQNRPTEVAGPGPVCSILPPVEAASYRQSATDTSGFRGLYRTRHVGRVRGRASRTSSSLWPRIPESAHTKYSRVATA
jgi:hypothetical protein